MPMPTPAELTLLQDPDVDPEALWHLLARMPKDVKKMFRAGEFPVPYATGVALMQAARNVPFAKVRPNLAAVLNHTEMSEEGEGLLGPAWDLFVPSMDPDEEWFPLSEAATSAFASRVSETLGKAPPLVVSKNQYVAFGGVLLHTTRHTPARPVWCNIPYRKRVCAADTLLWMSSTNHIFEADAESLLRFVSPAAWSYVPDTTLARFASSADFATLCLAREVALRMTKPDRTAAVEEAFDHIPSQLQPMLQ